MKYNAFAGSSHQVSRVGFGAMGFGCTLELSQLMYLRPELVDLSKGPLWQALQSERQGWITEDVWHGQSEVSQQSQWKPYEKLS
jgi:hypothetical protein